MLILLRRPTRCSAIVLSFGFFNGVSGYPFTSSLLNRSEENPRRLHRSRGFRPRQRHGRNFAIHLSGIDCRAKRNRAASALVFGRDGMLDTTAKTYRRTLAVVMLRDDTNVNHELVKVLVRSKIVERVNMSLHTSPIRV